MVEPVNFKKDEDPSTSIFIYLNEGSLSVSVVYWYKTCLLVQYNELIVSCVTTIHSCILSIQTTNWLISDERFYWFFLTVQWICEQTAAVANWPYVCTRARVLEDKVMNPLTNEQLILAMFYLHTVTVAGVRIACICVAAILYWGLRLRYKHVLYRATLNHFKYIIHVSVSIR